jgi:Flp pilus assembly protein TadD
MHTAPSLTPSDREHFLGCAVDLYQRGDLPAAERVLRGVLPLADDDHRPWALMGAVLWQQGAPAAAEIYYRHALRHAPHDPYTLLALGELAMRALRWSDALKHFAVLLEQPSDHPAVARAVELLRHARSRLG